MAHDKKKRTTINFPIEHRSPLAGQTVVIASDPGVALGFGIGFLTAEEFAVFDKQGSVEKRDNFSGTMFSVERPDFHANLTAEGKRVDAIRTFEKKKGRRSQRSSLISTFKGPSERLGGLL